MIYKTNFSFIALAALLLSFFSCSKELEETPDMGYDYVPTEQGLFVSYQVQSIIWDDLNLSVDTTYYQVQMIIDTMFTDNMGRKSFRWNRYTKTDTTDWLYDHTYALTKTTERLETVEGNNRYIRLAFPVRLSNHWDINAFNIQDPIEAQFIDVDVPKTISSNKFSQCAIVLIEDNQSLISNDFQEDTYARGVGLVQRVDIHIKKEFTGEITKGYKLYYRAYDFGKK